MVNDERSGVRLDVWLDVACLFKTRSEAQKACKGGKLDVNRQPAKPNRLLRVGDEIEMRRMERIYRAAMTPPRAPDKRQRRALRKMKGRDD